METEARTVDNKEKECSLLVIVLDTNPSQQIIRRDSHHVTQILDSICAFSNAHLMQRPQNKLAVLDCHHHGTEFLYPTPGRPLDIRQVDGQYEVFTLVEKTIKQKLAQIISDAPKMSGPCESLLAGSIAMALSYITRLERNRPLGTRINARILVVTGSNECASQYMTYMNVFFTAQKQNIVLDVCALDKSLTLLQQGCDITGGQYLRLPQLEGLLQYLLWVFLPDPETRLKLVLPPPVKVDYRAACFCHRELIDIGYVCSVCFTVFKSPPPIAGKPKKKKVRQM
ncbi:General transcription factor IIH subunit 3 [Pseudolycoriella hygida]|uniref:General transcription factor IIH subunit 3 n=1 Tax=Pseudolycoriella hygida TaxID=35572 RepID=A0A9Q0NH68_9DIPT|nr:General transcription factor IIH subunit 3 [Pseudolycoriella hygida]